MDTQSTFEFYDDLEDNDQIDNFVNRTRAGKSLPLRNPKKVKDVDRRFIRDQSDHAAEFKFTYKAARFEEWWLLDSLGDFYEHKWISDVLRKVKGGKEASVYMCRPGVEVDTRLTAAKVYRPRSLRNLKNDGMYRAGRADLDEEGRQILNHGMMHAMANKTEYGKELLHQSWISYEYTSLEKLFEAGVDVPRPFTMAKNAILMDFVGDEDGCAPALNEVSLDKHEAKALFDRVLWNIDQSLALHLVHGDLSAYNILYWEGSICFIDFPQVVAPEINKNAFSIFQRDVVRVCDYFHAQGVKANGKKIATELWTSHGQPLVEEVDVRHLDAESLEDLAYWKKKHK